MQKHGHHVDLPGIQPGQAGDEPRPVALQRLVSGKEIRGLSARFELVAASGARIEQADRVSAPQQGIGHGRP